MNSDPPPAAASLHVRLLQRNKTFSPHVLPIQVGTVVDFPNADPIFHNAFSSYDGQLFDVGLYPPGSSRSVRFRRPGIVRVFCNIHASMSAVLVVLDTPYFTRVVGGSYSIPNVSPDAYQLHVFDERATEDSLPPILLHVTRDPLLVVPEIHVSESGYVQLPHKNKYGHDYAPEADTYGTNGPPK